VNLHQQEREQNIIRMVKRKNKMAGSNTEIPTGKAEKNKMVPIKKEVKPQLKAAPVKKAEKKIPEVKTTEKEKKIPEENTNVKTPEEKAEKKTGKKISIKKIKKDTASVNISGSPVSTKYAIAICKFLKWKKISVAIKDMEEVSVLRKAVPMTGEYAHRKGKMMSGKFPVRASKEFLVMLKSLLGNANQNNIEEPIIIEAIANKGPTTYGRGGRVQKKRSNIKLVCTEKKLIKQKQKTKK